MKTKRPHIKRLNWPFVFFDIEDVFGDCVGNELRNVPIFTQDGWYLMLIDGKWMTWYQINGKAYRGLPLPHQTQEQHDKSEVHSFKWTLRLHEDEENDVGITLAKELNRLWQRLPHKYQRQFRKPIWAHNYVQQLKDTSRGTRR